MRTLIALMAWLIVLILTPHPGAWAQQQPTQLTDQDLAGEFSRLIERWQKAQDPEVEIAALEALVRLEPQLTQWPHQLSREIVRGRILRALGDSYQKRRQGSRADNLEAAIQVYDAAVVLLTRDAAPHDWAQTQNSLANAYHNRIRGSRADNLEAAIRGYEAALTVRSREATPRDWAGTQNNLAISYSERIHGSRADSLEAAIRAYEAALIVFTREAFPQQWATAQNNLAISYSDRIHGSRADNLERAIAAYEAALTVRTREALPQQWATTQNNLANAYRNRIRGSRAGNLEAAIKAAEAALTVLTREAHPRDWATAQNALASAYSERIDGSKSDNLEAAITAREAALAVFTREAFPRDWSLTQNNLATDYRNRIRGSRADNVETAIKGYVAALTVFTREAFPQQWASTQNNLAIAYRERIRGSRADNLEAAIKAFEAVLTVFTREAFPQQWANTRNDLSLTYQERIRGSQADNMEAAIEGAEAALTVFTRGAFPHQWAAAQNNLATAYDGRVRASKADNLETAIKAYEAALTVFTREAFPEEWATTQNNLANAYRNRIRGSRADNLERAIAAYEAALTVFTREAFPHQWAATQNNLAMAYYGRVRASKADNLETAIKAYEAALTVFTREAFPRNNLQSGRRLGQALLEKRDWGAAKAAYAKARATFALLFGQGLEEEEAQDLIAEAGPLFAEAAYVAAQSGDPAGAFDILAEGKARLMAVALRQQSLELPPDRRARLADLRVEIRQWRPIAETTKGEDGARALERLIGLRRELGELLAVATPREAREAVAQARALLPPGGVLVAPIVTGSGGKILLLRSGQDSAGPTVIDLPELTTARLAELLRGTAGDPKATGWLGAFNIQYLPEAERAARWPEWHAAIEAIGGELWRLVGGALQKSLTEAAIEPGARMVWMPAGALGLLPVGLAQEAADTTRLGDTYEIVSMPNLDAMAAAQRRSTASETPSLAVIVNPTGDLPFTETESAIVAARFPPEARMRFDKTNAEPSLVLAALKGKSHWHFSSHGTFDWSDARQSGLVMKGKQALTVQSLLDEQGRLGQPRLVVLSACETGLFDADRNPDEFVGLPTTFMQLGAAGVIGTLWQVDDLATALVVARFYELHLDGGLAPPTALKQAQAWLRSATKADLIAYTKDAAIKAKLGATELATLESQLKVRSHGDTRFSATWKLLQDRAAAAVKALGKAWNEDDHLKSRPFEHPIYWGAFVYTGL